jgi:AraC family transcriptional regulator of adaptative response / DNA-3-methyladenine glycosylase II
LRKQSAGGAEALNSTDTSKLLLSYRAPYDWAGILEFLKARRITGVESIAEETYRRTVRLGTHRGWIAVRHLPENHALSVELTRSLTPALPALLGRLRHLFDLNARPDLISAHLMRDPRLRKSVLNNPGLRVPGAFDGFELAVRAVLGQQVTVKAATTLACRFAEEFGDAIATPFAELTRLSPLPQVIVKASVDRIAKLGIISARASSILALAQAFKAGDLRLDAGANPDIAIQKLTTLPGIGPWTAHYIAMRALRWPDAFPTGDIAVLNNLGGISAKQAAEMSRAWRPWRSYAVLHIWRSSAMRPGKSGTPGSSSLPYRSSAAR